jgi:hypothetical protein
VAPEARSWAAFGGREAVAALVSSGGRRWGMELTARARLTERRGRGGQLGRCEPKEKTACGGCEASGLAGSKAEWAARSAGPKVRKKNF